MQTAAKRRRRIALAKRRGKAGVFPVVTGSPLAAFTSR